MTRVLVFDHIGGRVFWSSHQGVRYMEEPPRHDQTTADEALGPEEKAEAHDPNVGEGTPTTAPERPVPETLLEKTRRLLRRH